MNRGIRDGDYGKWDDFSEAGEAAGYRALADGRGEFEARLRPGSTVAKGRHVIPPVSVAREAGGGL